MGEILPDGTIQGYYNICDKCNKEIEVNFQGTEIGKHDCNQNILIKKTPGA